MDLFSKVKSWIEDFMGRSNPQKAETALIKYIFLDIVGFAKKNRSVESQADLIGYLNSIVRKALDKLPSHRTILIPTGDGICIALIDIRTRYDIHLKVALDILSLIHKHNSETQDETRNFEVRIGLNENVDNLVTDVNGKQNVAGMGINMAQRTMSKADGGQILVGETTYQTLHGREVYMKSFRRYKTVAKHGIPFDVYQYIDEGKPGLNIAEPSEFASPAIQKPPKLSKLVAYFIAHAIKNKQFFISRKTDESLEYSATILLYLLAHDSIVKSETTEYDSLKPITWQANLANLEQQYNYYDQINFWVNARFAQCIALLYLDKFKDCFEPPLYDTYYAFITNKGKEKLKKEWPDIWEEFQLRQFEPIFGS